MSATPQGEILLYQSEDGAARIECRFTGDTLWLSLNQIADLFDRDKSVISKHLKSIFEDGELSRNSVVANHATTAADGKVYQVDHYNLEAIFAVGYRVRSARGIQFRTWATALLRDFVVKGFVMDDQRLKNPGGWDYFDELLERIREIRASEKRFYQKVRDLFALSSDYQSREKETQLFFAEVQNKLRRHRTDRRRTHCRPFRRNRSEHGIARLQRFARPQAGCDRCEKLSHRRRNRHPQPVGGDFPRTGRTPRQETTGSHSRLLAQPSRPDARFQ